MLIIVAFPRPRPGSCAHRSEIVKVSLEHTGLELLTET